VCGRSITARGTSFGRFFFARFQRGPRASTCQRKKTKARQCTALRQTAKSIRVFIVTAARKIRRRAGGAARRGAAATLGKQCLATALAGSTDRRMRL